MPQSAAASVVVRLDASTRRNSAASRASCSLAIITQDTQDPPHPIALVMNPWDAALSEGVTYRDRLLATATIASTGAQIAAATTA